MPIGFVPVLLAAFSVLLLRSFDAEVTSAGRGLAPRVQVLEQLRMLEGAELPVLKRLAEAVTEETLAPGAVVIRQGDPADELFVLVDGTLVVEYTVDGATRQINEMAALDYLGEIGLVERRPQTATVTTSSAVMLWRIPGALFLEGATGPSSLSSTFAGAVSTRLVRTPGLG